MRLRIIWKYRLLPYRGKTEQEWREHSRKMQEQLDEERKRGWVWRFIDGKRIDY